MYVVAPPALMLDPALDPRDVVGMTGQRNPQPCPHRHARKLASTIELEQQLAAAFEEGDEGEEATALKVRMITVVTGCSNGGLNPSALPFAVRALFAATVEQRRLT